MINVILTIALFNLSSPMRIRLYLQFTRQEKNIVNARNLSKRRNAIYKNKKMYLQALIINKGFL